jgi:hypothetical protein
MGGMDAFKALTVVGVAMVYPEFEYDDEVCL